MKVQHVKTIIIVSVLVAGGIIYNVFLTPTNTQPESTVADHDSLDLLEDLDAIDADFYALLFPEEETSSTGTETNSNDDNLSAFEAEVEQLEKIVSLLEARKQVVSAIDAELEALLSDLDTDITADLDLLNDEELSL